MVSDRSSTSRLLGSNAGSTIGSAKQHIPGMETSTIDILARSYEPGTLDNSAMHAIASNANYGCSIDENDVVIAVMGPTGAGKSSFVNSAAGRTVVEIGYDLKSHTRKVFSVPCAHPINHRNIVLVDTPGFDDTYMSDAQILKTIAKWLKETYQNKVKLSGILYLHRISDIRYSGTPLRNLAVFKELCGKDSLKNIVLVTTMWDEVERPIGLKKEEELCSNYWKDMIHLGSRTHRFEGSCESAWDIIDCLNSEDPRQMLEPLQIQQEMVDLNLPLHETAAARTLLSWFKVEFRRVLGGLRRFRGIFGIKRRPQSPPSRPPSRSSNNSNVSRISSFALQNTPSLSSSISLRPSPAETTSTGCSHDRRETLESLITGLGLAYQLADLASVPVLRGTIGTVLKIAQMVEGMGGTHHAISQLLGHSGWLLEEIAQYVAGSKLSRDMEKTLNLFQKELKNLQNVVKTISTRNTVTRFFLYDVDVQAMAACTTTIKMVYDKLEVRLALESHQAIARLQEQLDMLCSNRASRQCECGKHSITEERQENRIPSMSQF